MSTTVSYKGETIATVNNNTKVLETEGTWLEDDITLVDVTGGGSAVIESLSVTQNGTYTAPSGVDGYSPVTVNVSGGVTPTGTKQISITENGTITEDVTNYANAEITVNVSGSSVTAQDIYDGLFPVGDVVISDIQSTGISLQGNTRITSFKSTSLKSFLVSAFLKGCTALEEFELTATVGTMQGNFVEGCTALKTIKIPNLNTTFPIQGAKGCTNLEFADIGNASQIIANAFNGCTKFNTLVIRRTSVCSLQNINAFSGTCFASGGSGGTIYVPSNLISSYQTASNWSTIHGYGTVTWVALEGSDYE